MANKLHKGTILGFSGSWGSGMGFLKIKKDSGEVVNVPCDNAPTVRSLEACYGDTIGEGHTVKSKPAFVGKKIYYEMESWGTMAGFSPVEEATPELEELYAKQHGKKGKLKKQIKDRTWVSKETGVWH